MLGIQRLPQEPAGPFAALNFYLALGPFRSIQETARHFKRALSTISTWSRRYHWKSRAEQYDSNLLAVEAELKTKALQQQARQWALRQLIIREREWEIAQAFFALARNILDNPRLVWTTADAANLLETASTIGRLACADPHTQDQHPDRAAFYQQLCARLQKVYGSAPQPSFLRARALLARMNTHGSPKNTLKHRKTP